LGVRTTEDLPSPRKMHGARLRARPKSVMLGSPPPLPASSPPNAAPLHPPSPLASVSQTQRVSTSLGSVVESIDVGADTARSADDEEWRRQERRRKLSPNLVSAPPSQEQSKLAAAEKAESDPAALRAKHERKLREMLVEGVVVSVFVRKGRKNVCMLIWKQSERKLCFRQRQSQSFLVEVALGDVCALESGYTTALTKKLAKASAIGPPNSCISLRLKKSKCLTLQVDDVSKAEKVHDALQLVINEGGGQSSSAAASSSLASSDSKSSKSSSSSSSPVSKRLARTTSASRLKLAVTKKARGSKSKSKKK
jgi:hypothetical protein